MNVVLQILIFLAVAVALSLANTVGYHRLLTHRSFRAHPAVLATLTFLSALHSGPPGLWVSAHHVHHLFADRKGDPHSPLDSGYGYAHVGWLFGVKNAPLCLLLAFSGFALQLRYLYTDLLILTGRFSLIRSRAHQQLARKPLMRLLDTPLVIPALFAIQLALAWWIAAWSGIAWLWAMHVLQNNASWLINSACHTSGFGVSNPQSHDLSRDIPALAWITNGDSYHNSHHMHPTSAKHALNGGWDLSWGLICGLARLGLASDVRLPPGYAYPAWLVAARSGQADAAQ